MDDDPLAPIEKEILRLVLARIQMRARMAIERDLHELEDRAGRKLPTVRAQLEHLAAMPELPALPPGGSHDEPGDDHPSLDDGILRRKPGRPKKKRDAEDSDGSGTELS